MHNLFCAIFIFCIYCKKVFCLKMYVTEKHLEGTNIEAKDVGDESKSTDKSMFRNILMIVIICFVCICIIDKSSSIKQQKVETEIQKFVAELDVIKTSFPSQSQKLWKIVK